MNKETAGMVLRALLVLAVAIGVYYAVMFAVPLLYPFIIGWLIAMAAEPMVKFLERRLRVPRWAGVLLSLSILVGGLSTLLVVITSRIVVELTKLAELLPAYLNEFNQYIVDTLIHDNPEISSMIQNIQEYMQKNPEQKTEIIHSIRDNLGVVTNKGTQMITDIIAGIGSFLGDLPYIATVLIFIILAAFFIGIDWPRLRERIHSWFPERLRKTGGMILQDLRKALFGFMRAQLILITITGILVWVGLLIMQVDYALTVALVTGLVDLLPYLGVGAVLVPWSVYLLITGNIHLGAGIGILYIVIIVVRQLLEPKLVATNIGLDPLLTLIALFVGLKLMGVFGLILGPVTAILLLALHRARVFQDVWLYIKGKPSPHSRT